MSSLATASQIEDDVIEDVKDRLPQGMGDLRPRIMAGGLVTAQMLILTVWMTD